MQKETLPERQTQVLGALNVFPQQPNGSRYLSH